MEAISDQVLGEGSGASRFARLPTGVRIHHVSHGDESNPSLILIHGWTCTTPMFRYQYPFFSSRYRCVFYDPRSTGRSEKTSGRYLSAARG